MFFKVDFENKQIAYQIGAFTSDNLLKNLCRTHHLACKLQTSFNKLKKLTIIESKFTNIANFKKYCKR